MAEGFDHAGDMQTEQADERCILVLWINRLAFIDRIVNREIGVGRAGVGYAPAGGDCDPLHGDLPAFDRYVDASGLAPGRASAFAGPLGS